MIPAIKLNIPPINRTALPRASILHSICPLNYQLILVYLKYCLINFIKNSLSMQGAGFEPANHYGLGPKPSAFDQARLPLLLHAETIHGQNYYTR